MTNTYQFFSYSIPEAAAPVYSSQAVAVLKDIRQKFPELFDTFKVPSEILTLSGVRAFDTYMELGKDISEHTIQGLKALLKKHGILLLLETFPVLGETNPENRYSLLHLNAYQDLPNRYGYIPGWRAINFAAFERDGDFYLWWLSWKTAIAIELEKHAHLPSRDWIKDFWTSNDISFGMLLGYPGEAICSLVNQDKELVPANILLHDKFEGPVPVYDYAKKLAGDPHIVGHEKLWSDILMLTYKELGV